MKSRIRLVVLGIVAVAASAQIYKWVDEEGQVHFGDSPPESAEVEEMKLPEGPTEEESEEAQRRFQEQIEARKIAEETRSAERQDHVELSPGPVSGPSSDILADDQFACGRQLSNFVSGESESERLYEPLEPTELDSEQRRLLIQLLSTLGRDMQGEKTFYKCMGKAEGSEIKTEYREAISSGTWDAEDSELAFKTETVLNFKTTGTLFEYYKVDDSLYFYLKSLRGGRGHVAAIPPNLKKPGNMVRVVSLGPDRLAFLIKKRNDKGILKPQLHAIERSGNVVTIKRASFVNALLTDWVITRLSS